MSLQPTLLQQTLTDEFQSFPVLSQSSKKSHANLSSYSVSEKGEAQTTAMVNEAVINDACWTSICSSTKPEENSGTNVNCPICNQKSRVSLIQTHVDICLRKENTEFKVIPDIIISDYDCDDKSCVGNNEMEIQKELNCLGSRKKLIETIKERLRICSIDLTKHLLLFVRRGFCFYHFSKFFRKLWSKKRWNFQYRFAFVGECGGDKGGVSRESYSGKTRSGQLSSKCFPSIHYFHKSNFNNVPLVNFIVLNQVVLRRKNWRLQASVSRVIALHSTCLDISNMLLRP